MKHKSIFLTAFILFIMSINIVNVFAATPTLQELLNNKQQTITKDTSKENNSQVNENTGNNNVNEKTKIDSQGVKGNGLFKDLGNLSVYTESNPESSKVGQAMSKGAGFLINILLAVLTIGLVFRIIFDLLYICLPFARSFLSNGYVSSIKSNNNSNMGLSGMPFLLGRNMMNQGNNCPANNNNMINNEFNEMARQNALRVHGKKIQWISNKALDSVVLESMENDENSTALRIYMKNMIVVLVLTPILIALAVTGVLTKAGFALGSIIVSLINGFGGMM